MQTVPEDSLALNKNLPCIYFTLSLYCKSFLGYLNAQCSVNVMYIVGRLSLRLETSISVIVESLNIQPAGVNGCHIMKLALPWHMAGSPLLTQIICSCHFTVLLQVQDYIILLFDFICISFSCLSCMLRWSVFLCLIMNVFSVTLIL